MSDITLFAKTNFRNQETPFGIKTDDRRRHMYIIGKTGMGKTNLLENLVIQDIQNGHGVAYIDPHGDTAEKLIKAIPKDRIKDVIYFNPADQEFPIAFNVMEKVEPEYRHLVASGLVGVFKKLWADSWGPRLEYMLRNAILGLLESPDSTLLGVMRILVDKEFREQVVEKITDPVVRSFWIDEFPKWNERVLQEVVSPIQNKVGQFLSTSLIRNLVGQTESAFSIREAMDNKKIIILNLSKGRIGEDASHLLGAMMITKIQLAAMGRVDISEEKRKDFYLYVDEFQNFATEAFADILSEARKYRLNLILAHQFIAQLDETVRDSVFGNAGTLISFRVGAADAEFLEKEYEPVFTMNDIVNLPKFNIYLKLMIDGIAGDAFSAITLPTIDLSETQANEEEVIKFSREEYASSKEEVEDKIAKWSGMISDEVKSKIGNIISQQSGQAPSSAMKPVRNINQGEIQKNIQQKIQSQNTAPNIQQNQPSSVAPQNNIATPAIPQTNLPNNNPVNQINNQNNQVNQQAFQAPAEKKIFDALCDGCGVSIQVPFQPDGKRPTFCKECLKEYQREISRIKAEQGGGNQFNNNPNPASNPNPNIQNNNYNNNFQANPNPPVQDFNTTPSSVRPQSQPSQNQFQRPTYNNNYQKHENYSNPQRQAPSPRTQLNQSQPNNQNRKQFLKSTPRPPVVNRGKLNNGNNFNNSANEKVVKNSAPKAYVPQKGQSLSLSQLADEDKK